MKNEPGHFSFFSSIRLFPPYPVFRPPCPHKMKAVAGTILLLLLPLFLQGCGTVPSRRPGDRSDLHWPPGDKTAKRVVILPFENDTAETDLHVLERKSFYDHFASKNYRDLELSEVDRVLTSFEKIFSRKWRDLPPQTLCKIFDADYVIYGRVRDFSKIYLGVYSQLSLEVEIKMVEGSSRAVVWQKTLRKRAHEGGVPFSLFGIVPAALRCGFHLQEEKVLDLVERTNRELVSEIPEPPCPAGTPVFVDVQIASFKERARALKTVRNLERQGLKPRIETVSIGERHWHRVIVGPYYRLSEANRIKAGISKSTPFDPILIHRYPPKTVRN